MKTVFISAKSSIEKIEFDISKIKDIKKIDILTTVQFLHEIGKTKNYLTEQGFDPIEGGQVLGCEFENANKIKDLVDGFLYIGSGNFHPIGITLQTTKPVFIWHPGSDKLTEIDKSKIDQIQKKKKGMYTKFLSSKVIGVLVSTKPGQYNVQAKLDKLNKLKTEFPKKEFYFFLTNTFDFKELDNFNFIESWINAMCPRIAEDINVLNYSDLETFNSN